VYQDAISLIHTTVLQITVQ